MNTHKLTPEQAVELVIAFKAGTSTMELCSKYNISQATVSYWLRKAGCSNAPTKLSADQEAEVVRLRMAGMALSSIMQQTNLKLSTIRWTLSKSGVKAGHAARSKNSTDSRRAMAVVAMMKKYGAGTWNDVMDLLAASRSGRRIGEYQSTRHPLEWECGSAHRFLARPNNVRHGQWCPECAKEARRLPFQEWRTRVEARGGTLVSPDYLGCEAKHIMRCAEGHDFEMVLDDVASGHWCPSCAGNAHSTETSQRDMALAHGGQLLTTAVTVMDKAHWGCSAGHDFWMRPNNVQQGQWCAACSAGNHASRGQTEVVDFISSLVPGTVSSCRSVISPLELDVYVPEKKVGIEYDGLLWHSSYLDKVGKRGYDSSKHLRKYNACVAAGISLFAFFDDEWTNKKELVQAMIRWRLGCFQGQKLHARKLECRRLETNRDFRSFFDANHLDGHANASFAYGLFYNDRLVCCASVRHNFAGEVELARLATDYHYAVRGGAARMIAAIQKETSWPLVSYSNNRLSQGNIYKRLGFTKIADNRPSYWYTDGNSRIWRFRCRRNNDPETLVRFPTEQLQALGGIFSRAHFADDRPLYQIHDYGHQKWLLTGSAVI